MIMRPLNFVENHTKLWLFLPRQSCSRYRRAPLSSPARTARGHRESLTGAGAGPRSALPPSQSTGHGDSNVKLTWRSLLQAYRC